MPLSIKYLANLSLSMDADGKTLMTYKCHACKLSGRTVVGAVMSGKSANSSVYLSAIFSLFCCNKSDFESWTRPIEAAMSVKLYL